MTDAPDEIWMWVSDFGQLHSLPQKYGNITTSYTRTDLIPALEAAAYARGLEDAAKVAECRIMGDRDDFGEAMDVAAEDIAEAIRALGDK